MKDLLPEVRAAGRPREGRAGRALARAALLLAGLVAPLLAAAQPSSPPAEQTSPAPPEGPPPPAAGSPEIPPDAVSFFQTRAYRIKPRKLWKGLLETLAAAGYPPEEVDEKVLKVKSSFVDFEAKQYSEHVADPPPQMGSNYNILQLVQVKQGKVSLEAIVAPVERGAAVSVRARMLVEGLDRRTRVRLLADRKSSGVIEDAFFDALEDALGLERL